MNSAVILAWALILIVIAAFIIGKAIRRKHKNKSRKRRTFYTDDNGHNDWMMFD